MANMAPAADRVMVAYSMMGGRCDSLIVWAPSGDELIYAGKVDRRLMPDLVTDVRKRLAPLVQKTQAFSRKIKKPNAVWVMPSLAAEIEYRAKSEKRSLDILFSRIREDL